MASLSLPRELKGTTPWQPDPSAKAMIALAAYRARPDQTREIAQQYGVSQQDVEHWRHILEFRATGSFSHAAVWPDQSVSTKIADIVPSLSANYPGGALAHLGKGWERFDCQAC